MTLGKAIRILKNGGTQEEFLTATKLAIEALKRLQDLRLFKDHNPKWQIPGETDE